MNDMTQPKTAGQALALPTSLAAATTDFSLLMDPVKFEQLWRVSKLFASSEMVPQQYQGKPENVFVASQAAMRLAVDPFMFMQHCPVVHGRPGLDGQLAIALINQRGPFTGPIQWRYAGEGNARSCTAYAVHARTGDICEMLIHWSTVEGEGWIKNSKWKTMTDQMFRYRTAAWLGRAYCPEVLMGLPTSDELEDIVFGAAKEIKGETLQAQQIQMPRAKANPAQGEPASASGYVDTRTGEIIDQHVESKPEGPASGETSPNGNQTGPAGTPALDAAKAGQGDFLGDTSGATMQRASDAQRKTIMDIAKRGGLSIAQLDEHLVEAFGCGVDELPMAVVNKAIQLTKSLKPA